MFQYYDTILEGDIIPVQHKGDLLYYTYLSCSDASGVTVPWDAGSITHVEWYIGARLIDRYPLNMPHVAKTYSELTETRLFQPLRFSYPIPIVCLQYEKMYLKVIGTPKASLRYTCHMVYMNMTPEERMKIATEPYSMHIEQHHEVNPDQLYIHAPIKYFITSEFQYTNVDSIELVVNGQRTSGPILPEYFSPYIIPTQLRSISYPREGTDIFTSSNSVDQGTMPLSELWISKYNKRREYNIVTGASSNSIFAYTATGRLGWISGPGEFGQETVYTVTASPNPTDAYKSTTSDGWTSDAVFGNTVNVTANTIVGSNVDSRANLLSATSYWLASITYMADAIGQYNVFTSTGTLSAANQWTSSNTFGASIPPGNEYSIVPSDAWPVLDEDATTSWANTQFGQTLYTQSITGNNASSNLGVNVLPAKLFDAVSDSGWVSNSFANVYGYGSNAGVYASVAWRAFDRDDTTSWTGGNEFRAQPGTIPNARMNAFSNVSNAWLASDYNDATAWISNTLVYGHTLPTTLLTPVGPSGELYGRTANIVTSLAATSNTANVANALAWTNTLSWTTNLSFGQVTVPQGTYTYTPAPATMYSNETVATVSSFSAGYTGFSAYTNSSVYFVTNPIPGLYVTNISGAYDTTRISEATITTLLVPDAETNKSRSNITGTFPVAVAATATVSGSTMHIFNKLPSGTFNDVTTRLLLSGATYTWSSIFNPSDGTRVGTPTLTIQGPVGTGNVVYTVTGGVNGTWVRSIDFASNEFTLTTSSTTTYDTSSSVTVSVSPTNMRIQSMRDTASTTTLTINLTREVQHIHRIIFNSTSTTLPVPSAIRLGGQTAQNITNDANRKTWTRTNNGYFTENEFAFDYRATTLDIDFTLSSIVFLDKNGNSIGTLTSSSHTITISPGFRTSVPNVGVTASLNTSAVSDQYRIDFDSSGTPIRVINTSRSNHQESLELNGRFANVNAAYTIFSNVAVSTVTPGTIVGGTSQPHGTPPNSNITVCSLASIGWIPSGQLACSYTLAPYPYTISLSFPRAVTVGRVDINSTYGPKFQIFNGGSPSPISATQIGNRYTFGAAQSISVLHICPSLPTSVTPLTLSNIIVYDDIGCRISPSIPGTTLTMYSGGVRLTTPDGNVYTGYSFDASETTTRPLTNFRNKRVTFIANVHANVASIGAQLSISPAATNISPSTVPNVSTAPIKNEFQLSFTIDNWNGTTPVINSNTLVANVFEGGRNQANAFITLTTSHVYGGVVSSNIGSLYTVFARNTDGATWAPAVMGTSYSQYSYTVTQSNVYQPSVYFKLIRPSGVELHKDQLFTFTTGTRFLIQDTVTGNYIGLSGGSAAIETTIQNAITFEVFNDPSVYNNNNGGIALKAVTGLNADNEFLRHFLLIVYSHGFRSNDYDFAWKFIASGGQNEYTIYNWYGGYYLNYDGTNVHITTSPRVWRLVNIAEPLPVGLAPAGEYTLTPAVAPPGLFTREGTTAPFSTTVRFLIQDTVTGNYIGLSGDAAIETTIQNAITFEVFNDPSVFKNNEGGIALKAVAGTNFDNEFLRHAGFIVYSQSPIPPLSQFNAFDFAWKFIASGGQNEYTIYNWYGGVYYLDYNGTNVLITTSPRVWRLVNIQGNMASLASLGSTTVTLTFPRPVTVTRILVSGTSITFNSISYTAGEAVLQTPVTSDTFRFSSFIDVTRILLFNARGLITPRLVGTATTPTGNYWVSNTLSSNVLVTPPVFGWSFPLANVTGYTITSSQRLPYKLNVSSGTTVLDRWVNVNAQSYTTLFPAPRQLTSLGCNVLELVDTATIDCSLRLIVYSCTFTTTSTISSNIYGPPVFCRVSGQSVPVGSRTVISNLQSGTDTTTFDFGSNVVNISNITYSTLTTTTTTPGLLRLLGPSVSVVGRFDPPPSDAIYRGRITHPTITNRTWNSGVEWDTGFTNLQNPSILTLGTQSDLYPFSNVDIQLGGTLGYTVISSLTYTAGGHLYAYRLNDVSVQAILNAIPGASQGGTSGGIYTGIDINFPDAISQIQVYGITVTASTSKTNWRIWCRLAQSGQLFGIVTTEATLEQNSVVTVSLPTQPPFSNIFGVRMTRTGPCHFSNITLYNDIGAAVNTNDVRGRGLESFSFTPQSSVQFRSYSFISDPPITSWTLKHGSVTIDSVLVNSNVSVYRELSGPVTSTTAITLEISNAVGRAQISDFKLYSDAYQMVTSNATASVMYGSALAGRYAIYTSSAAIPMENSMMPFQTGFYTRVDGSLIEGPWIQIEMPIPVVVSKCFFYGNHRLYTLLQSSDGGASWTTVCSGDADVYREIPQPRPSAQFFRFVCQSIYGTSWNVDIALCNSLGERLNVRYASRYIRYPEYFGGRSRGTPTPIQYTVPSPLSNIYFRGTTNVSNVIIGGRTTTMTVVSDGFRQFTPSTPIPPGTTNILIDGIDNGTRATWTDIELLDATHRPMIHRGNVMVSTVPQGYYEFSGNRITFPIHVTPVYSNVSGTLANPTSTRQYTLQNTHEILYDADFKRLTPLARSNGFVRDIVYSGSNAVTQRQFIYFDAGSSRGANSYTFTCNPPPIRWTLQCDGVTVHSQTTPNWSTDTTYTSLIQNGCTGRTFTLSIDAIQSTTSNTLRISSFGVYNDRGLLLTPQFTSNTVTASRFYDSTQARGYFEVTPESETNFVFSGASSSHSGDIIVRLPCFVRIDRCTLETGTAIFSVSADGSSSSWVAPSRDTMALYIKIERTSITPMQGLSVFINSTQCII